MAQTMFGLKSGGPNVKLVVPTSTKQGTSPFVRTDPKFSSLNKQLSKTKSRTFGLTASLEKTKVCCVIVAKQPIV